MKGDYVYTTNFFFLEYIIMGKLQPIWQILEEHGITPEMIYEKDKEKAVPLYDSLEDCKEEMIRIGALKKVKKPHSFITISLPAERFEGNFAPEVAKCLERNTSMLNDNSYIYNLEFYGKDLEKYHPHVHLLIKGGGLDKSKIIRAFSRHFKIDKNFIDVKRSEDERLYIKRENYIKGIKQDNKAASIEKDEEFRKKHNIEKFFSNDII